MNLFLTPLDPPNSQMILYISIGGAVGAAILITIVLCVIFICLW